jgi:hypothetical protein
MSAIKASAAFPLVKESGSRLPTATGTHIFSTISALGWVALEVIVN